MECKQGNEHKQEGKEIRLRNSQGSSNQTRVRWRAEQGGLAFPLTSPREANSGGGSDKRRVAVIHKCTSR